MGERYLITGVQLGMLIAGNTAFRRKIAKDIENDQWVGNSENNNIIMDVRKIKYVLENKK